MSVAPAPAPAPAQERWRPNWWVTLTALLAFADLVIAAISPIAQIRWPALAAGALVLAALAWGARAYPVGVVALVVAAAVPTVTTWWSLLTPATAALVVACGIPALRSRRRSRP